MSNHAYCYKCKHLKRIVFDGPDINDSLRFQCVTSTDIKALDPNLSRRTVLGDDPCGSFVTSPGTLLWWIATNPDWKEEDDDEETR